MLRESALLCDDSLWIVFDLRRGWQHSGSKYFPTLTGLSQSLWSGHLRKIWRFAGCKIMRVSVKSFCEALKWNYWVSLRALSDPGSFRVRYCIEKMPPETTSNFNLQARHLKRESQSVLIWPLLDSALLDTPLLDVCLSIVLPSLCLMLVGLPLLDSPLLGSCSSSC